MARVDVPNLCGADNGLVHIDYAYDDVSPFLILEVSLHNDGTDSGTVVAQVYNAAGTVVRTRTIANGAGTVLIDDVSALGLHMVMRTGAHGTSLQLPGAIACTFTPGR